MCNKKCMPFKKKRKQFIVLLMSFLLIFLNISTVFAVEKPKDKFNKNELQGFMDNSIPKKMEEMHIPGVVITVVKDNDIVFSKGYGYSNLETKEPMTADKTLLKIASVTKVFTYTALMQVNEQGKVDLNEDVNKYLKGYTVRNKYSKPVTVEQLLTHTSGIDDHRAGELTKDKKDLLPINDYLKSHLPAVVREPGTVINYCSYDTALAGGIVEQVSGTPLNKFIVDNIFKPLEMKNSTLDRDLNPKGVVQGYKYEDGKIVKSPNYEGYFNNYPVGGIISTADDMSNFMIAHLNNGLYKNNRILKEDTAINMHKQHTTFDVRLPGIAYGFYEEFIKGYRTVGHAGYSPDNIYSKMSLFPEEHLGIFVSVNQGNNNFPDDIISMIVEKYLPKKDINESKNTKTSSNSKVNYKEFVGTYRFSEAPRSTFQKAGSFPMGPDISVNLKGEKNLFITGMNEFTGEKFSANLVEIEPLVFKREDNGEYFIFKKNTEGRICYFAQEENSWHGTYEKLKWYESASIQIGVALFCVIVFLVTIVSSIIRFLYNIFKRKNNKLNHLQKSISGFSFIVSVLNISFFISAFYLLGEPVRYGVNMEAKLLMCIPILSLFLSLFFLVAVIIDWKNKNSKLFFRIWHSIIVAAAISYMWFLNYWNLLGFKFW